MVPVGSAVGISDAVEGRSVGISVGTPVGGEEWNSVGDAVGEQVVKLETDLRDTPFTAGGELHVEVPLHELSKAGLFDRGLMSPQQ